MDFSHLIQNYFQGDLFIATHCYTRFHALKPHRFLFYRKCVCPAKRSHRAVHADRGIRAGKHELPRGNELHPVK